MSSVGKVEYKKHTISLVLDGPDSVAVSVYAPRNRAYLKTIRSGRVGLNRQDWLRGVLRDAQAWIDAHLESQQVLREVCENFSPGGGTR